MADRDAEEDSTSVDFGEFGKERPLPLEYLRDWCRKFKHKLKAKMTRQDLTDCLSKNSVAEICRLGLTSVSKESRALLRDGFVVLEGAAGDVTALRDRVMDRHRETDAAMKAYNQVDALDKTCTLRFKEAVCWKQENFNHRDLYLPDLAVDGSWHKVFAELSKLWPPSVCDGGNSVGVKDGPFRPKHAGALVSLPGSENQHVHRDTPMRQSVETSWTPPFQFVVLLPLVPLTEENGPTEFFVGSQLAWKQPHLKDLEVPRKKIICNAGDAVIFDSRVCHRGTANRSTEPRPVAYWVFTRENDNGLDADGNPVDPNYGDVRERWPSVFDAPEDRPKRKVLGALQPSTIQRKKRVIASDSEDEEPRKRNAVIASDDEN